MKKQIVSIILCICMICSIQIVSLAGETIDPYEKYETIMELFAKYQIDPPTYREMLDAVMRETLKEHPELFEEMMSAALKTNEKYSGYYDADTYEILFPSVDYYGIGVGVNVDESERITIGEVYRGPALAAGLLAGDRLLKVDGEDVSYGSVDEVGEMIRGKSGTSVAITVYRPSEDKTLTVYVERGAINTPGVVCNMLTDDIAYMRIEHFNGLQVFVDFCMIQNDLIKKGVGKIIIDVRHNRGGDGDVVCNILNQMISDKDIVISYFRSADAMDSFVSAGDGAYFDKLVVLADSTSYSSAEIFAGAVKDLKLGIFVGETTAGKGKGQHHVEFIDGSVAAITTSEVVLPKTGAYHGVGITPDIRVANELVKVGVPDDFTPINYTSIIKAGDPPSQTVKAVEERLNFLGFLVNVPDENLDPRCEKAIASFQKAVNLNPDGRINASVIRELERAVKNHGELLEVHDSQLDAALEILK